jgi:hypothetical protein
MRLTQERAEACLAGLLGGRWILPFKVLVFKSWPLLFNSAREAVPASGGKELGWKSILKPHSKAGSTGPTLGLKGF